MFAIPQLFKILVLPADSKYFIQFRIVNLIRMTKLYISGTVGPKICLCSGFINTQLNNLFRIKKQESIFCQMVNYTTYKSL